MKKFILILGLAVISFHGASGQSLQAVTSPAGPGLEIIVSWPTAGVSRFNLYRTPGPAAPLNAVPIARLTSCAQIQAVMPTGSDDWNLLSAGLAQSGTPFDPCAISTVAPGSAAEQRLQFIARANWRIAIVAGQAYRDTAAVAGTAYTYQLRGVDALGNETGAAFSPASVTAGSPSPIAPPPALTATAGDYRVLLLWGDQSQAAGFLVYRAPSAAGPFLQVNSSPFVTRVANTVDGAPLATPSNGFLDIERWDVSGQPATHVVNGIAIAGPADGITYHYKVASIDILGQTGPMSASVSAIPVDSTPPATPIEVAVTPLEPQSQIEIRWTTSTVDVEGHADSSHVTGYQAFRYDSENAPLSSGIAIGGVVPQPGPGVTLAVSRDTTANLRPPFGEKTHWYRVRAIDGSGNRSAYSAAIGGHLDDITPPAPPKNLAAVGADDLIGLQWSPNVEPDLDHYEVFRSYCHNGKCNPCDPSDVRPVKPPSDERERSREKTDREQYRAPCTGEYVLVGSVSLTQAKTMAATVVFRDTTIPAHSPVCYSYWVKAYDQAQNMSGDWPFPDVNERTVCQRLRDTTPPDPAIISGLFARDARVRIEWIAGPVQDIRAYHIYRADRDTGPYAFVGGMTVERPPTPPQVLTSPYKPPPLIACDTIPLITIDSMSMGFGVDETTNSKNIYWYKVLGVDQSGNESPIAAAVPMSTFTYATAKPDAPVITSVTATTAAPFELVVSWTPPFNPATIRGFAVFRRDSPGGLYRQVGTLLEKSEFHDDIVVKHATYWYQIVRMDRSGQISEPSAAASGSLTP